MAKRKIHFFAGGVYHVYNRGVQRGLIFQETENYHFLLRLIGKEASGCGVGIIAYCLMPNHYHFLLRQKTDTSISIFIQRIFNAYTKAFNKRFSRTGTLFETPFKSIHVDSDAYLLHLCSYIHRNPIDSMPPLVSSIDEWPYSNYPEWVGKRNGVLFDRECVKQLMQDVPDYVFFVLETQPMKVLQRLEKYCIDESNVQRTSKVRRTLKN
jgi:REP element-mobilizing transposase RayT